MKKTKLFAALLALLIGVPAWAEAVSTQEDFNTAVANATAGATIELSTGEYTLPGIPANITITAAEGAEVVFNCAGSGSIASIPNGATFEGVTMNFGQTNYHGFQHAGTINMNGCVLNGLFFSYGDMNFNGCTFNQDQYEYMMWDYGKNLSYIDCVFNGKGKFINVYNEGNGNWELTVAGCTFNNVGEAKKAPLNIKETSGSTLLGWDVTIGEGNTLVGNFPENSVSDALIVGGDGLWQVDDRYSDHTQSLVVVKDAEGTILYEAEKPAPETIEYYAGSSTKQTGNVAAWKAAVAENPNTIAFVSSDYAEFAEANVNVVVKYEFTVGSKTFTEYSCPNLILKDYTKETPIVNFYTPVNFTAEAGSYTRVHEAGMNTVCLPFAFDSDDVEGGTIGVFIGTDLYGADGILGTEDDGSKVFFGEVDSNEAGKPCLVSTPDATTWDMDLAGREIVSYVDNASAVKGAYIDTNIGAGKYKVSSDGTQFAKTKNATCYAFRSYMDFSYDFGMDEETPASSIAIDWRNGGTTEIMNTVEECICPMFDLMGRQITNPTKGEIYIMNGKKIIY